MGTWAYQLVRSHPLASFTTGKALRQGHYPNLGPHSAIVGPQALTLIVLSSQAKQFSCILRVGYQAQLFLHKRRGILKSKMPIPKCWYFVFLCFLVIPIRYHTHQVSLKNWEKIYANSLYQLMSSKWGIPETSTPWVKGVKCVYNELIIT